MKRVVHSIDNQWFPLPNKAIKSDICSQLNLYTSKYTVKHFLNTFPLGTHICCLKHQNKREKKKKHTHSTSCQSPLTVWWLRQSHVLQINTNTKMAIIITVENILAQRKISTIGIKSFSGKEEKKQEVSCSGISWVVNDLVSFFLIGSLHRQLLYTEQSSTYCCLTNLSIRVTVYQLIVTNIPSSPYHIYLSPKKVRSSKLLSLSFPCLWAFSQIM